MYDDLLIQVSNNIKEIRKQKNITIQTLADKAKVRKGLISQIDAAAHPDIVKQMKDIMKKENHAPDVASFTMEALEK
ncbi:MAG: helix-turn-helix transcriptional regulator [Ferruginibacter sp.]